MSRPANNRKTVLVVDDSKLSRMMIGKIIHGHFPDWRVIEAVNGDGALQAVAGQDIDIMTIDINMPGMDGLALGSLMRERYPQAAITLVTANIQSTTRQKAEAAGLQFIPKPITEERILGYLRAANL